MIAQTARTILYRGSQKYLDTEAWANSVDPAQTPQNTASNQD